MTLKLGNSEQNCEKKKCFKGFKTLGRRSRVLTNRGCKVLHTKLNFRSPYSHAENPAVPFCAGVENKQCFSSSERSEERGAEQEGPRGVRRLRAGLRVRLPSRAPPSRSGPSFGVRRTTFFSPRLLLSRNRQTHKYSDLYPPPPIQI